MYSRLETALTTNNSENKRQRISASGHVASKRLESGVAHASQSRREPGSHRSETFSTLAELDQQGSARIRLPNSNGGPLQAVLVNTAGGLTGGDDIRWSAKAGEYSQITLSTAACEKLYRTQGPAAHQRTHLVVENYATLEWLPQETIVFDNSSLQRSLTVELEEKASALIVESLVLGRRAMDEAINTLSLHDRWRIYRQGKLIHAEDLKLQFGSSRDALRSSVLHQFSAVATLVYITPETHELLHQKAECVRILVRRQSEGLQAAASVMNQRLVIRVLAHDSQILRKFLIPCIEQLSHQKSVPQVWNV